MKCECLNWGGEVCVNAQDDPPGVVSELVDELCWS